MKKKLTLSVLLAFLCLSVNVYSQQSRVGINTSTPNSTLDVNGIQNDPTDVTGFQAPRLTLAELTAKGNSLYGASQKGTLIYITDNTTGTIDVTGQRINIKEIGYYFFDGTVWQKVTNGASWYNAATNTGATANTQNIYQMGNVGIGTNNPTTALEINSATPGAIKIVDGNQGLDKVLVSDANGVGTWKSNLFSYIIGTKVPSASFVNEQVFVPLPSDPTVTSSTWLASPWSIDLPPGKWALFYGVALSEREAVPNINTWGDMGVSFSKDFYTSVYPPLLANTRTRNIVGYLNTKSKSSNGSVNWMVTGSSIVDLSAESVNTTLYLGVDEYTPSSTDYNIGEGIFIYSLNEFRSYLYAIKLF